MTYIDIPKDCDWKGLCEWTLCAFEPDSFAFIVTATVRGRCVGVLVGPQFRLGWC